MKKILRIMAIAALSATFVHAELVGSLHVALGQGVTNSTTSYAMYDSRTTNGAIDTQGTIQGSVSVLGAHPTNLTMSVKTFSAATSFVDLDRYASNGDEGLVVWDFDVSSIVTNAWDLKLDYSNRNTNGTVSIYVSINGLNRTLDTTVVTNLPPGSGGSVVANTFKYIKIAEFPALGAMADIVTYDLTEIIEAAQANDGLVRLACVVSAFKGDIQFNNESGLVATDIATGTAVDIPKFLVADEFGTGSATLTNGGAALNGWYKSSGPENLEYNVGSSGILTLRDELIDPLDGTNGVNNGAFDNFKIEFEPVKLAEEGDWLELSASVTAFADTSGSPIIDVGGPMFQITLVDSSLSANAGYGFYGRPIKSPLYSQLQVFNTANANGTQLGDTSRTAVLEDTFQVWSLRIERIAGDQFAIEAKLDGTIFGVGYAVPPSNVPVTNNACIDSVFDMLTFNVRGRDVGLKVDEVTIITNVKLTPYETWLQSFGLYGTTNAAYASDPDEDLYDNMHEWGLGGDPTNELDQGIAPAYSADGSVFTYIYPKNPDATDISYFTETSDNLVVGVWTNIDYSVGSGVHSENADLLAVTNELPSSVKDEQFIRLILEETP